MQSVKCIVQNASRPSIFHRFRIILRIRGSLLKCLTEAVAGRGSYWSHFGESFTKLDDLQHELLGSDLKILMFHRAIYYALFTLNSPLK